MRRAIQYILPGILLSQAIFAGTGLITNVAGTGVTGSSGTGGPATGAQLNVPVGLCYDSAGNLYIADFANSRVVRVDAASGTLTLVAGNGVATSAGDGGPALTASLYGPAGVAVDPAGNLYISEVNGSRVRRVDMQTGIITTYAGSGLAGSTGDAGPATAAGIPYPIGLAFDAAGNLYIAESSNNIRRVDTAGTITTALARGIGGFTGGSWLASDHNGNLLIPDGGMHKLLRLNLSTGMFDVLAGNGGTVFNGDGMQATNSAIGGNLGGVAVDASGNVYLSSSDLYRIRRIDPSTGIISTIAGTGSFATPGPDGVPANIAQIKPMALATGPDGSLAFTDTYGATSSNVHRVSLPSPYNATATTFTMSPAAVNPGQSVTFTAATLPVYVGGSPFGTVSFVDTFSGQTIGDVLLTNGTATLTTATPAAAGSYGVVAMYRGDSMFAASASPTGTLTVQTVSNGTSLTLASTPNPASPSDTVSIVAYLYTGGSSLTPTGTLQLLDAGTVIATSPVTSTRVSFSRSFFIGTHPLTAVYSGDSNFGGSTSPVMNQVVRMNPSVSISSSVNPATAGGPLTLAATVSPAAATGVVEFVEYAPPAVITWGIQPLVNGVAVLTFSALPPTLTGTHNIQAYYHGDTNYNSWNSSAMAQQIVKANPTVTLNSNMNPGVAGTPFSISATVAAPSGVPIQPTGSVQLFDATTSLGTVSLTNGVAQFPVTFTVAGTHPITALYSGDASFVSTTSNGLNQVIKNMAAFSAVINTPNPSVAGSPVTFSVNMAPTAATGTIELVDASSTPAISLGTASLANGSASLVSSSLSVGTHTIRVTYSGDANFTDSSTNVTQIVKAASTTSLAAAPATAAYGQAVQLTASVTPAAATGTVQFTDGANVLGTVPVGGGTAVLNVSSLAAGAHAISAVYSGDAGNGGSASTAAAVTITKATPSISLSSSQNPSTAGQAITFTFTLTPATATGTVQLMDGSIVIASVSAGTATASVTPGIGSHSLTAVYSGDSNYNGATSAAVSQLVNTTTGTSLSADFAASTYGQPVRLTAMVTPAPAGGTVQFLDGSAALGTVTLQGGAAALTVATLSTGTHAITAVYSGDGAGYLGSTSAAYTETVNKASSTIALSASANPVAAGQAVTFSAAVSPANASGTVQFLDGGATLGVVTVNGGAAAFTTSTLTAGTHSITAVYGGDALNVGSTSTALSFSVVKVNTTTVAGSSLNPSAFGQAVTLSASVTPVTATGTIQFLDGGASLGVVSLSGGSATLTTSSLAAAAHSLTAVYSGDAVNNASTSATLNQTVNKAATSVTITSSLNPAASGQTVTFSTSLSPASAGGSVQFKDGATVLGSVTVSGGTAALSVSSLAVGTHSITAIYGGNANYAGSTSPVLTQTVNVPPPDAPSNLTATVNSSSQIKLNWTASPTSGVTYNVYSSTTSGFTPSVSNRVATGVSGTNYNHTGLTPSTTYYYLVTAQSSAGQSAPTNQANAATQSNGLACHVVYSVTTQWNVGFGTAISIQNTGTQPLNNWSLTWTWAGNQQITQSWNSTYTQTGSNAALGNVSWNKNIAAGVTVTGLGFNASYSGTNAAPTAFYVNGTLCQ